MIHCNVMSMNGNGPSPILNFTHLQVPVKKEHVLNHAEREAVQFLG